MQFLATVLKIHYFPISFLMAVDNRNILPEYVFPLIQQRVNDKSSVRNTLQFLLPCILWACTFVLFCVIEKM